MSYYQKYALDGTETGKTSFVGGIISDIVEEFELHLPKGEAISSVTNMPKGLLDYKLEYGNLVNVQITKDKTAMMKLGKFLTKSGYSDKQARDASSKLRAFTAMAKGAVVRFTETGEQVKAVYANGPRSCMKGEDSVRVYVGDDVSVAFVEVDDSIVARAVVNKKEMQYTTVYGNSEILEPLLEKAGFTDGNLEGCRVPLIRDEWGDRIVMPYVDYPSCANVDGDYVLLTEHGEYSCQEQGGYLSDNTRPCEECDDNVCEDEEHWCEYTERLLCSSCHDDSHVYVDDEYYHKDSGEIVETYKDGYMLRDDCGYCGYHNDWFPMDEIVYSDVLGEGYHTDEVTRVLVEVYSEEEDYVLNDSFSTAQDEDGYDILVWDEILDEYNAHIEELNKQEEDDE
jgi:hypothetical protein